MKNKIFDFFDLHILFTQDIKKHPAFRQGVILICSTAITEENRRVRVHISG